VAVDADGNVYVADLSNNRVTEYDDPFTALTTDGQSAGFIARRVFGQVDFASAACNQSNGGFGSATAATLCGPRAVAIDNDQRLYVADSGNSRVLGYYRPLEQPVANIVIGQLDFLSYKCNMGGAPSASSLCLPAGVAADGSGNLYVGDQNNNRVLEYDAPRNSGQPAHLVFGQSDLTSNQAGGCGAGSASASGLCLPAGVALDSGDNLYVADSGNNRVLEYLSPLAPGGGSPGTPGSEGDTTADLVFGQQGNFSTTGRNEGGLSAESLAAPAGVAVDDAGGVFIADTGNNRVLEYNGPSAPISAITPAALPTPASESSPCPSASVQSSQAKSNQPEPVAQAASPIKVSGKKLAFGKSVFFASTGGGTVNKKLTLTNTTATAFADTLTIDSASADASDFTATDTAAKECNGTVPAHKSCQITVSFTPTSLGKRSAILDIQDSTGTTQAKVDLTGVSFAGAIGMSAKTLSFGKVANGSASKPKKLKLSSKFTVPATISGLGVFTDKTGATASTEYTVDSSACGGGSIPFTVVKSTSCTLMVTFDPYTGAGKDPGFLLLTDDAAKSPQIVSLTGKATGPTVTPPATPTPTPTPTSTSTPATTCTSNADCTDTGTTCQSGTCACTNSSQTDCGPPTGCTDTTTDPSNCGGCGSSFACATGQTCVASTCTAAVTCTTNSGCTDTGTTCQSGTCACSTTGQTDCGAQAGCTATTCIGCTDTTTDVNNCGGCGASFACAKGDTCVNSTCTTPITCSSNSDCTTKADPGTTCQSGVCACPTGQTDCGSTDGCQDTTSSSTDCGVCGNACDGTGENGTCQSSQCELGTPTPAATPTPSGPVILSPSQVRLFGVPIGTSQSQVLTLTNEQPGVPLSISAINFTVISPVGATLEWSETDTCGINGTGSSTLSQYGAPGDQCTITVTFAPMVGGAQIVSLSIASDYTGTAPSVELIASAPGTPTPTSISSPGAGGPGSPPPPVIAPSSINFGSEVVGGTSNTQTVTVTNDSQILLIMNASPASPPVPAGVAVTGPFTIVTDDCSGVTLAAQAKCTVTVAFSPTVVGSQTGNLVFGDNAATNVLNPQSVQLLGTGSLSAPVPTPSGPVPPIPAISPSNIDFGSVTVAVSSAPQTVTVTNQSQIALVMASPATSIVGSQFAVVADTDTCSGVTLGENAKCSVSLTFTPTGPGAVTGSVTFLDNARTSALNSQSETLLGDGSLSTPVPTPSGPTPPPPVISPSSINFGTESIGGTSAAEPVTVTNQSNIALVMASPAVTVTGPFAIATDGCSGTTLDAQGKCSVELTYTATAAGPQTGTLTFTDNAPNTITNPQNVPLVGTGSSLSGTTATPVPSGTPVI